MNLKSDFTCKTCNKILWDPISIPCTCNTMCKIHVDNLNVKQKVSSITCQFCKKKFDIPKDGFPENKMVKSLIEREIHLSDDEKALKESLGKCFIDMDRLLNAFKAKTAEIQAIQTDHFVNVRKSIDTRRESLIQKINQLSEETIKKVNESEEKLKKLVAENNVGNVESDIQKESQNLFELFRNPNLAIQSIEKYRSEVEQKQKEIELKFNKFESIKSELTTITFESKVNFDNQVFGDLNIQEDDTCKNLITCYWNKSLINIWDMNTNSLKKTLSGHSQGVRCLRVYENFKLISGGRDNLIKIWDLNTGLCIRTLTGF
jgi:WD40 repeat protein